MEEEEEAHRSASSLEKDMVAVEVEVAGVAEVGRRGLRGLLDELAMMS